MKKNVSLLQGAGMIKRKSGKSKGEKQCLLVR